MACPSDRSLKTGVAGPDPALRGLCECSHTGPYAPRPKKPRALAEGLGLVFQRPAKMLKTGVAGPDPALRGLCECSHTGPYAPRPKKPRALAEGLGLVFRRPARAESCVTTALSLTVVFFFAAALSGCVSLQVQKARQGVDPVPLAGELAPGTSTLQDALSRCGAPDEIVDMDPDFALLYRHALQRGAKVSVGFPLKYALMPNPSLETRGNLVRTDALVLVFTPGGLLKDVRYEHATDRPLIEDYWQ